jgi:2-aminoethylphosphonate-pyruvate transaminase
MTTNRLLLLTPGPVSVSRTTQEAMLVERPSGDVEFQADLQSARNYLVSLAHGGAKYVAVPVPGSATYANEAVIAALVPAGRTLLVHSNGVYGDRLLEICAALGTPTAVLRTEAFTPPEPAQFAAMLDADPTISHIFIVHCETSTGILNPLDALAALCRERGIGLLVDAVASFGAVDIDAPGLGIEAITISSNKCMQGVPGIGWAVVRRSALEAAERPRVLCLDLADQAQHMDRTGLFRFTPPVQVLAAFAQACREHEAEGGTAARIARYRANWRRLVDGMRQMGFRTVVPDSAASPIVATFHNPEHPAFSFDALFDGMKRRGFVIFPGRLALQNTFRIGCMGAITEDDIARAMVAVADTMGEMGVGSFGRADPPG